MKRAEKRSVLPILRAYLESGSPVDNERIAELIIEKAIAGEFGYFKLVLELVDGKLYRTAEQEMTSELGCVFVVADDLHNTKIATAA